MQPSSLGQNQLLLLSRTDLIFIRPAQRDHRVYLVWLSIALLGMDFLLLFPLTKLSCSERDLRLKALNSANHFRRLKQFLQILRRNGSPSKNFRPVTLSIRLNRFSLSVLAPNKSIGCFAKLEIGLIFSAILLFVPSPVRAENGYACSDIQPMRMRSKTLYPRVSCFPLR